MRTVLAAFCSALLLLGAAPSSAPSPSVPREWREGTERLVAFLEHLENGTRPPFPEGAVYGKSAPQCTKEEFRARILMDVPDFVFRKTRLLLGNYDGLLFEKAMDYVGMANAAYVRIDEGMLDGRKAVIVSHGFLHLHYAADGRITSCAAYLEPGVPR